MPTRNVNLTEHFDKFVVEQVSSGRFKNASEVMRAGLRLLENQNHEEEEKLALLRSLAAEGFDALDQGQGTVVDNPRDLREFIGRIGLRAVRKA
ncbi:MAG: type II toxin-antitoxin system ParD family antitoxin [Pirellulales bacterium]|nr:type II toxin-antitoxin system ParD family antitoxin [Pirellulales bacterium]